MYLSEQRNIWDENWAGSSGIDPSNVLGSRFTMEAYRAISRFIEKKDRLIIEAGCGTGRLACLMARDFPDSSVTGLDISENSVRMSNELKRHLELHNASFEISDLFRMPYVDSSFNVVFNEGVIEHYSPDDPPTYDDALREMIRITKRRGKVIVAVPNWFNLPHTLYKFYLKKRNKTFKYGYEKSFRMGELVSLFERAGLGDIEVGGFYPAHGVYRLSGGRLKRPMDLIGGVIDKTGAYADKMLNGRFSKRFGFEVVVKGVKP